MTPIFHLCATPTPTIPTPVLKAARSGSDQDCSQAAAAATKFRMILRPAMGQVPCAWHGRGIGRVFRTIVL